MNGTNGLTPAPTSVRTTSTVKATAKASESANGATTRENGATRITNGSTAPEASTARADAAPEKPIKLAKGSVCSRQTARVSVQASTEPGVYVMRLLDDDETTLPGRAVEGLLVLVDPEARLPTEDSN
jgi:hypothetical protein